MTIAQKSQVIVTKGHLLQDNVCCITKSCKNPIKYFVSNKKTAKCKNKRFITCSFHLQKAILKAFK